MSREELRQRYLEINGAHPMSGADDAYVTRQFRVLEELCAEQGRDVEAVRRSLATHHSSVLKFNTNFFAQNF